MIILEEPYVSDVMFLFLERERIPVLNNNLAVKALTKYPNLNIMEEQPFIEMFRSANNTSLYTVSEYALDWVYNSIDCSEIKEKVSLLKNKAAFRKACSVIYKDFYYKEVSYPDLLDLDVQNIPFPMVLKPSVGFLSAGVFIIKTEYDWKSALYDIKESFVKQATLFPDKVVASSSLIIESYIAGREFAIDVYFNNYEPVIVNIFEHLFASDTDVSDRLYTTSKKMFDNYLDKFTQHIKTLNEVLKIKDMAIHLELRMEDEKITPIEANPMRFTGLCLNELHNHIAGKHPLSYFFEKSTPNYQKMWEGKEETIFCFSVFDKSPGVDTTQEELLRIKALFSNLLEIRPVCNSELNITAFVFSAIEQNNTAELSNILNYYTLQAKEKEILI